MSTHLYDINKISEFAPNAQKSRNYLYATKTPFKICEQPFVLPRPILTNIGITYRRVPVLSIGKDVFCDNTSFIDALQTILEKEGKGLKKSRHDRAYEAWGYRSFWVALPCVPAGLISEGLAKDRKELFRKSSVALIGGVLLNPFQPSSHAKTSRSYARMDSRSFDQ